MKKIFAQGAEAILYKQRLDSEEVLVKDRIKKRYRIAQIDKALRRQRTRYEARLLDRAAREGVPVPRVLERDEQHSKLVFEFIPGLKLRDWLEQEKDENEIKAVIKGVGRDTAKLHCADIIHGDLTTSNLIKLGNKVYFIDFGLGCFSKKIEDKAVDLHLFKECLRSRHYSIWSSCWGAFLSGYKSLHEAEEVLERVKIVESRGRYKKKN